MNARLAAVEICIAYLGKLEIVEFNSHLPRVSVGKIIGWQFKTSTQASCRRRRR